MNQKIKRSILLSALVLVMPMFLFSQEKEIKHVKWGFEYDLMAPRIGQWNSVNLNAYVGHGRFKHSLIFAHHDSIKLIHG
jgi:hypothetical protein